MITEKLVFRRMESLLKGLNLDVSLERLALALAPRILEELGSDLDLAAVQIYAPRRKRMALVESWGAPVGDLSGSVLRLMLAGDGGTRLPWTGHTEAGRTGVFPFDSERRILCALVFADPAGGPDQRYDDVEAAVSSLHTALVSEVERHRLRDILAEAHTIQMSLLPPGRIAFGEYDIAAVSRPAESVGGDLYELIPMGDDVLGLGVADASGHGFPAAILARDVATALRMGAELDLKITRITSRLNRITHASGLTSRFISLFFGELELNGNLLYVNAGHPAPLLLDDGGLHELSVGGMILGPNPEARYKLGFAHIDRGAVLVAVSDGVLERTSPTGEEFGTERLADWLSAWRGRSAEAAVADLMERLVAFGDGAPFEDDVTALLVRRPAQTPQHVDVYHVTQ